MKKWIGISAAVCVMSFFSTVSAVSALDHGPDEITLNAQEQYPDLIKKKDKKKVVFAHKKHAEEYVKKGKGLLFKYEGDWTCGACHHKTKKGEQPVACLKCKDVQKQLAKVGGAKKFEKIYHKTCRDACHKKTDKKSAKCKVCHKKKK